MKSWASNSQMWQWKDPGNVNDAHPSLNSDVPRAALTGGSTDLLASIGCTMRIRRARESEASALSALAVTSKQYWGYSPQDIERWRPLLAVSPQDIASNPTFVAEVENEVVGFYSLVIRSEVSDLDHLWVSPKFTRRGIGRALLAHAVNSARLAGMSTIVIDADPNAEPFYVACGALRQCVVAAPIAGNPARFRPQLSLQVTSRAA